MSHTHVYKQMICLFLTGKVKSKVGVGLIKWNTGL